MRNTVVRARVDDDLKIKATTVFETVGLTMSDAIYLFLKQTVLAQAIPFPVHVPNATTKQAIQDVRERRNLVYQKP